MVRVRFVDGATTLMFVCRVWHSQRNSVISTDDDVIQVSCFKAAHKDTVRRGTREANRAHQQIILRQFGTSAEELRKKRTTSADELAAEKNILSDSRTTLQSASVLWQCLADVDLSQGESDDEEFVVSFALQFLVMSASEVHMV